MAGAVELALVPVANVAAVLEDVSVWIERAMLRAVSVVRPMSEIRAGLERGSYRLMLGAIDDQVRGAVVFEELEERGRRFVFVIAAGGVHGGTLDTVGPAMFAGLVRLGRASGCAGVRLVGRPGWVKWCARHGGVGVRVRVTQVLIDAR